METLFVMILINLIFVYYAHNYHEFQMDPDDQEDVDMTGEQVEIDFGGYGF